MTFLGKLLRGAKGIGISAVEAVIPNKVWNDIRPNPENTGTGTGILCIGCISRRLARKGYKKVPVWLCGTEPLEARKGDGDKPSELKILRNYEGGGRCLRK